MSKRSLEMFGATRESSEKFNYFVCGVAGALFAYIGQNYSPKRLELDWSLLEPIALMFLAAAFFVGLKQIEWMIKVRHLNARCLDASEKAGECLKALSSGAGPYFNAETGDAYDRASMESSLKRYGKQREELNSQLEKVMKKANRLYTIRDWLLLFGFVFIFVSKVLSPYF